MEVFKAKFLDFKLLFWSVFTTGRKSAFVGTFFERADSFKTNLINIKILEWCVGDRLLLCCGLTCFYSSCKSAIYSGVDWYVSPPLPPSFTSSRRHSLEWCQLRQEGISCSWRRRCLHWVHVLCWFSTSHHSIAIIYHLVIFLFSRSMLLCWNRLRCKLGS